jgi:transketolase
LNGWDQRIYVLMGDGESAEGAVWEAAQMAARQGLGNLCATIDINRLGQSEPTALEYDMAAYRRRWEAFGWQAIPVDGHNIPELLKAYEKAAKTSDRPTIVLAKTVKGKGLLDVEGKEGEHGKALKPELAEKVVASLEQQLQGATLPWTSKLPKAVEGEDQPPEPRPASPPPYKPGDKEIATRKAFGDALAAIGCANPQVVVLDGDVKNSTYTEEFQKACPDRFFQCYIAEQNMVGTGMGLAAAGKIPVAATFGCFLTRAYDFIRMAAISGSNIKLAGTHVGVSIGEDGPSQMALEDIAMTCAEPDFTVLYPSDATSAWRALELMIACRGPAYLRLGRPASPVIYGPEEKFEIGKCKTVRRSGSDRALIVTGGVTLFETLAACEDLAKEDIAVRVIDLFSIQPVDREALIAACRETGGNVITVEDHYAHGGLGDSVMAALAEERVQVRKLAVRRIPHSGKPAELLDIFGISRRHIADAVRQSLARSMQARG